MEKQIYLFGGLGNNLFQIEHGLSHDKGVVFVTDLVEVPIYSKLLRMSFHKSVIKQIGFKEELRFKKNGMLRVLLDLFILKLVRLFGLTVMGISWENKGLSRVNFGYYQYRKEKTELCFNNSSPTYIDCDVLIHMRLGDSPTQQTDVIRQLKLLDNLQFDNYNVVTNDIELARDILSESAAHISYFSSSLLDDFNLMRGARILIIPQSTLSLYAAYSSKSIQKLYVMDGLWSKVRRYELDGITTTY